jgi:hypothetical protein
MKDLHMVLLQRFKLAMDYNVNQGIREEDLVEVAQVTLQFIVKRQVAQREVDILTRSDRFFRKNDRLNFLINLDQNFNIRSIESLIVVKKGLKLEQAQFLYTLW